MTYFDSAVDKERAPRAADIVAQVGEEITCLRTGDGGLYLCALPDLDSGKVEADIGMRHASSGRSRNVLHDDA